MIVADLGVFNKDASGLWHYRYTKQTTVYEAAKDAIKYKPGAAWFWFNGTPAPIMIGDTAGKLVARWKVWRSDYEKDPIRLLVKLICL